MLPRKLLTRPRLPSVSKKRQCFQENRAIGPVFYFVRPAWSHSCGWSRRKLITANEVKRNCARATERGEEAWSVICELMNKNRIEGAVEQGERARNREALVIKAKWRKPRLSIREALIYSKRRFSGL